jgi:hypothetical protein
MLPHHRAVHCMHGLQALLREVLLRMLRWSRATTTAAHRPAAKHWWTQASLG